MIQPISHDASATLSLPSSFPSWRASVAATETPPIIGVAGSRGKSTVVRLLDGMFQAAGLHTAIWTNQGVEIRGRRQAGELTPWSHVHDLLWRGDLDVAIQEVDWATMHTLGFAAERFPIVGVTNLCINSESCLLHDETMRALRALNRLQSTIQRDGVLVLNGEDVGVAEHPALIQIARLLVGVSRDSPLVRKHLRDGGIAAWAGDSQLWVGGIDAARRVGALSTLKLALNGQVGFQIHNALSASAIAVACGISPALIVTALNQFVAPPECLPGSFNVIEVGGATIVIDRPAPSWFLRPAMRALSHLTGRRLIAVAGAMSRVSDAELAEVGRLIGRGRDALILHSQVASPERARLLRQGIAAQSVPPVLLGAHSEAEAVRRLLGLLQPGDLVFFLADDATTVLHDLRDVAPSASARPVHESVGG